MLILGIDTSTSVCSVAICSESKLICEWGIDNGLTHSEKMMPQLDIMLSECGFDKKDLTDIAVSIGPGSFTGLRIGLAAAKTMAFALGINITGVPTLEALAYNMPSNGITLSPMVDGQKGCVWHALYTWQNNALRELQKATLSPFGDMVKILAERKSQTILLGENIAPETILSPNVSWAPPNLVMPHAASVAIAAIKRIKAGHTDDLFSLTPYYMKKSEAEILWEMRHNA